MVEEYRKEYPVSVLCETLGVSLSGYYAWRKRPICQHRRADEVLADQIQEVYHACRQVYGSPRIHAELQAQGISSSRKRVARLMRERGLSARRPRHRTITTRSEPGARVAPNLLDGECVERTCFQTRREARQIISEYVECFYNRVRRHSSLGYISPVAYEQLMC